MLPDFASKIKSKDYFKVIGEVLVLIPDATLKLKFVKGIINDNHTISAPYKFFPILARSVYWKTLLDKLEKIRPGSKKKAKELARQGIISPHRFPFWIIYKVRHITASMLLTLFVWALSAPTAPLLEHLIKFEYKNFFAKILTVNASPTPEQTASTKPIRNTEPPEQKTNIKPVSHPKEPILPYLKEQIWLVEEKKGSEIYSNGLQIIKTHSLENTPRSYYRIARNSNQPPSKWIHTNEISGILYHASESDIFPFIPEMNKSIKRYSKALIRYIKRKKSYNYFIDRFGRVYRLVQEGHAANHAGHSIWADDDWIYLNLNNAFIAVCFEGRDFEKIAGEKSGNRRKTSGASIDIRPVDVSTLNEAQLRSGKELTDWLRVKYNINQNNCVPHALTSVNRSKMLIGYHLDLSRGFPFNQFRLSDKYNEPLPSMVEFGFGYDKYFEKIFDGNLWPGIRRAEKILMTRAKERNLNLAAYVNTLQNKYSRYIQWMMAREKEKRELLTNREKSKLPKPTPKGQPFS